MADILLNVPPLRGDHPSVSLQESLDAYQVILDLDDVTITFQGSLDALLRTFKSTSDMLDAFTFFRHQTSRVADRPFQEQARTNIQVWSGR